MTEQLIDMAQRQNLQPDKNLEKDIEDMIVLRDITYKDLYAIVN